MTLAVAAAAGLVFIASVVWGLLRILCAEKVNEPLVWIVFAGAFANAFAFAGTLLAILEALQ